ncbi:MAG: type II toxin-antitoxin system VapC family toxin [Pseudoclavibacter sp.]
MVTVAYLGTSAAMKVLVPEVESAALLNELQKPGRALVASWLLHTELHCAAGRHPADMELDAITEALQAVNLVDLTRGDLLAAGTQVGLRSNDAIHLTTALRVGADEFITYDVEVATAASSAGLGVVTPS